jgi:hypothetical protein
LYPWLDVEFVLTRISANIRFLKIILFVERHENVAAFHIREMNKEILAEDDSIYAMIEECIPIPRMGRASPELNKFTKILRRMKPLNSIVVLPKQINVVLHAAKKLGCKLATRAIEERGERLRRVWLLERSANPIEERDAT